MLTPETIYNISQQKYIEYLEKAYPEKYNKVGYAHFILNIIPKSYIDKSLFILNSYNIIGANLYIKNEALIGKNKYEILWSFDTKILPPYINSDAGVYIMEKWVRTKNQFGAGLSSISVKLQKKIGATFIGYSIPFIKIFPLRMIKNLFNSFNKNIIKLPDCIKVSSGFRFERLLKVTDFKIPHTGYWNEDIIEFGRNQDFIRWRFFLEDNKYYVYQKNDSTYNYLVVRVYIYKGIPLLYLVDYRFNLNNILEFYEIIETTSQLSKNLGLSGVYIRSSISQINKLLKKKKFISKGEGAQIVTKFKPATNQIYPIFFTSADSDMDFKDEI